MEDHGSFRASPVIPTEGYDADVVAGLLLAARMAEIHCRHALSLMLLEGDDEQRRKAQRQLSFVSAVIAKATTGDSVGTSGASEPKPNTPGEA